MTGRKEAESEMKSNVYDKVGAKLTIEIYLPYCLWIPFSKLSVTVVFEMGEDVKNENSSF
jgi:hypothetical protein